LTEDRWMTEDGKSEGVKENGKSGRVAAVACQASRQLFRWVATNASVTEVHEGKTRPLRGGTWESFPKTSRISHSQFISDHFL
jgi:hypothetical protein